MTAPPGNLAGRGFLSDAVLPSRHLAARYLISPPLSGAVPYFMV